MKKLICLFILPTIFMIGAVLAVRCDLACSESINKNDVNIRSGPGLDHRILFQAPLGYPVKVEKHEGDWLLIKDWEGNSGWIHKPLVSEVRTAVVLTNANIRRAAGKQNAVVARAKRGEIYKVMAVDNRWIQLGYFFGEGSVGWIRSDLVFGN